MHMDTVYHNSGVNILFTVMAMGDTVYSSLDAARRCEDKSFRVRDGHSRRHTILIDTTATRSGVNASCREDGCVAARDGYIQPLNLVQEIVLVERNSGSERDWMVASWSEVWRVGGLEGRGVGGSEVQIQSGQHDGPGSRRGYIMYVAQRRETTYVGCRWT